MMRHSVAAFSVAFFALVSSANAQSLSRRLADTRDGTVQFSFASRPGVCGDGATYVRDGFGDDNRIFDGGNISGHTRNGSDWPPCIRGPVRVVATVSGGDVVRLRTFAGARLEASVEERRDFGLVSVEDAVAFLTHLVDQTHARAASEAILPLVLADSTTPWPTLLRFARDERLSRSERSTVAFWLARGAAAALGVTGHEETDDDEVRSSAVFALSQQPKDFAIPQLIDVVRHNSHPAARAQALFWLGQSNDSRALDVFEEILQRR
ncbi:MAG: HEAT repeat domain-containing protein [Gemmatimonadaceae bacterium]